MITWRTNNQLTVPLIIRLEKLISHKQGKVKNPKWQGQKLWSKKKEKKTQYERKNWHIRCIHPMTKDTATNETIIHHPHGSLLMFVICASRDVMASGVRRSKHALACAQHPAPVTILSTERRYGIIEPSEHHHISLKEAWIVEKKTCHNYGKLDCILSTVRCMYHKLGLLECSQISQENWQYRNQMHPSCQKLNKQAHHLICQSINPSMTQRFSTLMFFTPQARLGRYLWGIV